VLTAVSSSGNSSGFIHRGNPSITRQNGCGVCLRLQRQMIQRIFPIWRRADGAAHLFGYNARDGELSAVSRPGQRSATARHKPGLQ
jgi:hypothetical protein